MSDTPRTDEAWELAQDVGEEVAWKLCRQLERENAALRADKERLDVLEQNLIQVSEVGNPQMDGTRFVGQCRVDGRYRRFTSRSLRDFADAARKEQP